MFSVAFFFFLRSCSERIGLIKMSNGLERLHVISFCLNTYNVHIKIVTLFYCAIDAETYRIAHSIILDHVRVRHFALHCSARNLISDYLTYFFSDMLRDHFSKYGQVVDCVVMKNPQTGKSRGFGFVTFRDPSVVEIVLTADTHNIDGRNVSKIL